MFRNQPIRLVLGAINYKSPSTYVHSCHFHQSRFLLGLEEFIEVKKANETNTNGRAWTPADLRKKVYMNAIWFTLCI